MGPAELYTFEGAAAVVLGDTVVSARPSSPKRAELERNIADACGALGIERLDAA